MSPKNVITAAVVALVTSLLVFAAFSSSLKSQPASTTLSGGVEETLGAIQGVVLEAVHVFKNGAGFGGKHVTFTVDGQIGSGANQASWRNTTNRTVFIDVAELVPTGNASTTMIFYVGTSTAATYSDNYAAPYATLIDGKRIATSSAPIVINNKADAGTNGRQVIAVAPGVYVNLAFFQGYLQGNCTGSVCEAATSTNRGFNVDWYLRGHYKP